MRKGSFQTIGDLGNPSGHADEGSRAGDRRCEHRLRAANDNKSPDLAG
jgi:hypothetical protein